MDSKEPYRATRLWNEVITAFQSGMPLKKHRRLMQSYSDCFSASDAVTWLHCYLLNNPNFGSQVTRLQTVNLLQKFLICNVIESVVTKKRDFADDSHLYRFTAILTQISNPSALCLIQPNVQVVQKENLPQCHIMERKLSPEEENLMWKRILTSRLEKTLPFLSEDLDDQLVNGATVKHNSTRLSKTGVVCLVDKTDDIPHWVISAMKCLANWPSASGSGSCLPNYPGFDKDVFKVVQDFFLNPRLPLLPLRIEQLLLKVLGHFQSSFLLNNSSPKSFESPLLNQSSHSKTIKTSTPNDTSHGQLLLDDPSVMWVIETDFTHCDPLTRIRSGAKSAERPNRSALNQSNSRICFNVLNDSGVRSAGAVLSPNGSGQLGCPLIESQPSRSLPKESPYNPSVGSAIESSFLNCAINGLSLQSFSKDSGLDFIDSASSNTAAMSIDSMSVCSHKTERLSSMNSNFGDREPLVWRTNELYAYQPDASCHRSVSFSEDAGQCEWRNELDVSSTDTLVSSRNGSRLKRNGGGMADVRTSGDCVQRSNSFGAEEVKCSFQLLLLLLPAPNRRHLHLLLRLLSKILKKGKFALEGVGDMRNYLLWTFVGAVSRSVDPLLMSFLVDHCESLFRVPQHLEEDVRDLSRSSFGRIKYYAVDECVSYCRRVSPQECRQSTRDALTHLLKEITRLPHKERRIKLKQFKETHPDVYYEHFPEKLPNLSRPKQSLLNKLVNLRI